MKKSAWIVLGIVVIIGGYFVFHAQNKDNSSASIDVFKVGAALPVTGVYAAFGEEFQRGAIIAEEEINQNNNLVQVDFEDTALDPKKAADAVSKLISANGVDGILVSAYAEAAATHTISDVAGVPTVVLWDSNPQLEAMGKYVFAVGPWTPASGEVTAKFAYDKGMRKAAIFGFKQEWSQAVSSAFQQKFTSLGGTVLDSEFSNPGVKDYRSQLSKVIAGKPDVVYMTTEDFLVGVQQIKELGFKGMILNSDLLDSDQIAQQPSLFEGVYASQVADPDANTATHLIDLYTKKYGEAPKKLIFTAWGYDGVQVLYRAHAQFPNLKLEEALRQLPTYKGASGDIKFDEHGTSKTIPKMFVVKSGQITLVK